MSAPPSPGPPTARTAPPRARPAFLLTPPGLALLYLLLLVPFVAAHRLGRFDVETDFFAEYAPYAESMSRGALPHDFPYRGPGYHAVLALVRLVCPDTFLAGKIVSALSAAGFVGLAAYIAALVAGPVAAPVAALLVGFQPLVYLHGWTVGNDMFFAMLALAVMALFVRAARAAAAADLPMGVATIAGARPARGAAGWRPFALTGLLAGYACLTRPNGLFLLPAGFCALWLFSSRPPGPAWRAPLAFLAGWGLPLLAWNGLYRLVHHAWPESLNYRNLAAGTLIGSGAITTDVYQQTVEKNIHGFGDLLPRLPALLAQGLRNIPAHLTLDALRVHGPVVSAAALVGLVMLAWRDRPGRAAWILPMAGAWAFAVLLPLAYEPRFSLFQAAPTALVASAAFLNFRTGVLRRWRITASAASSAPRAGTGRLAGALLVLVALLGVALTAQQSLFWLKSEQGTAPLVEAARFLRAQNYPPGAVAARKPHIAWYSGRRHAGLPAVSTPELPAALRARGVALFYYGAAEVEMLPQHAALLTPAGVPPGLQVVYVREAVPVAVLFRVLPADAPAPFATPALQTALARLGTTLVQSGLAAHIGARQLSDQAQRGALLLSQGRFAEAVEPLRAVAEAAPADPEAQFNYGSAAVESDRWEEGRAALRRAEALGLRTSELYLNLARALTPLDSTRAAEVYLSAFLSANPEHPLGLFHGAVLRLRQGHAEEADSLLQRAHAAGYPLNAEYRKLTERIRAGAR